jgi:hypothetical protein
MAQNDKDYATIQIRKNVKEQIVEFCNRKGYKIGRYVERLFINDVSGSVPPVQP